jgi:hypothetical protein
MHIVGHISITLLISLCITSTMSSTDPIIISDCDNANDPIVVSDDSDSDPIVVSPYVEAMRAFLRSTCVDDRHDDLSNIDRLINGTGFQCLAALGDNFHSAANKLSILLWVDGVTDDYWSYVVQDALLRQHTIEHVEILLEQQDMPIDAFIRDECIRVRLLRPPIPALPYFKHHFLERFRTLFPPVWHRYVMTSDTEIIFGNDLPSYWTRVQENPRRYY